MAKKNSGERASEKSLTALLLIDIISDFKFDDGGRLLKNALPAARRIAGLKKRAKKSGVPVIYINDNFGKWREDFQKLVAHCLKKSSPGSEIVRSLKPETDDYFVLKPKHSAFYSTTLDLLLGELKIENLILTGIATDICVLFTANDAYMRGYRLFVPEDCVAAVEAKENAHSLKYIERVLKADTRPAREIEFAASRSSSRAARK